MWGIAVDSKTTLQDVESMMLSLRKQIDNAQEIGRFAADSLGDDEEEQTGKLVEIMEALDTVKVKTEELRILMECKNGDNSRK